MHSGDGPLPGSRRLAGPGRPRLRSVPSGRRRPGGIGQLPLLCLPGALGCRPGESEGPGRVEVGARSLDAYEQRHAAHPDHGYRLAGRPIESSSWWIGNIFRPSSGRRRPGSRSRRCAGAPRVSVGFVRFPSAKAGWAHTRTPCASSDRSAGQPWTRPLVRSRIDSEAPPGVERAPFRATGCPRTGARIARGGECPPSSRTALRAPGVHRRASRRRGQSASPGCRYRR